MICTGRCCSDITINIPYYELRHRIEADLYEQCARIWVILRPVGDGVYRCAALTSTGCQLLPEQRPRMCTDYPYGGDKPCVHCGAMSDAEARGVALVHRRHQI